MKYLLFPLFLVLFAGINANAQYHNLFIDAGVSTDFFQNNTLEYFEDGRSAFMLRGGIVMKVFNNEKLSLHVEGGLTTRKFIRNMPGARFEYRFFTAEVPIMVNYELHKRWFVEGGLSASAYAAAIETENPDTRIGEGLRHYDFAALAGFQFLITDHFLLGARGRLGFLPMLEYTPIAASGEFGNTENDITLRNFEVYLRYRFTF